MSPKLRIPVDHPHVDEVEGLLEEPRIAERDLAVLLAHGAGSDVFTPFLDDVSRGLVELGLPVLRFRYPYMERHAREGRRLPPDRAPALEDAHARALAELRRLRPRARILLCGKSMGSRMGSHLAARGEDASGLVHLGYPLHPAKHPERERSEHFPAIPQPALFLQGTRDALCDLTRLRRALERHGGVATLRVLEGADHGFDVLKRSGRTTQEVRDEMLEHVRSWLDQTFPA